jgi:AsmA protein
VKALRIALYAAGGLVALAVLAAIGVAVVVDGAFVKSRLEQAMKEKNRTLRIEGDPKLRLFPVAGIGLGKTSLTEPGSDRLFLALESAEVAVRVLPLVSGEVAVETLKLAGLKLNVVRAKDGRMNFADLAGERAKEKPQERGEPPNLRVAEIAIERVQINFRDEATGQELSVSDLGLKTGRLDGATPGAVSFGARVTGRKPDLDLRAEAKGGLRFNLGRGEFGFDGFAAQAKGRVDRDTLAAEFSAPKVEISPDKASGSAVAGSLRIAGPQRKLDAKLQIAAVEGSARALAIPKLALDLDATAAGTSIKAKADAAIKANLEREKLDADVSARLDESTIKAKLGLTSFAPVAATFDIHVDRINLDRYAPPKKEAGPDRVDLSGLKGPSAGGKIAIDSLSARRVKLSNVKAEVKLAGGKLEVAPHSAVLYGGTLAGSLSADADGNRIKVKETLQGVNVAPLLRDAADQDRLEGRANVNLDVATAGASVAAMKKALGGSARVELKDGAVKGFNLAESFRDVKSVLGSKSAKAGDATKKTDFSEITASFAIKNGVAHNEDLQGKSPFLRLSGAGDLDIGNNTINYVARASLVATTKGQEGQDLAHLAGVTVPVKLTGALDKPDWSVDYGELAAKSGVGRALGKAGEAAGSAAGSVRDKIRGLFGR